MTSGINPIKHTSNRLFKSMRNDYRKHGLTTTQSHLRHLRNLRLKMQSPQSDPAHAFSPAVSKLITFFELTTSSQVTVLPLA